jgi:hypothetical protein
MQNMIYKFCYGHSLYIGSKDVDNINPVDPVDPVDTNASKNVTFVVMPNSSEELTDIKTRLKYLLFFLYNACIITIISWSIFYTTMKVIKNKKKELIPTEIFQILFSIQYIIGIWFFNTKSFRDSIKKKQIRHRFKELTIISFMVVILISFLVIMLIIYNQSINDNGVFKTFYMRSGLTIFLLCLNRYYTYSAFFANMTIFFVLIHFKKKAIDVYTDEITEYFKSSYSSLEKISYITRDFTILKNDYDNMIDDLNIFFSSLSIIGIIGIYFVLISASAKKFDSIEIIHSILILIVVTLYIKIAQNLRSSIKQIENSVKNPALSSDEQLFHMTLNNTPNFKGVSTRENIGKEIEISTAIYTCIKGIEEKILSEKLNKMLISEWNSFQFFGIQIKDTALIQKLFAAMIGLIFTSNLLNVSSILEN